MQRFRIAAVCLCSALLFAAAGCRSGVQDAPAGPRTIRVVQTGNGDVVGTTASRRGTKAADMLRPGDTLEIGPGTYTMHNSLFAPRR